MRISQKCIHGLRAIFSLASHQGGAPLAVPLIAEEHGIPVQFLQGILRELKNAGFVASRRGKDGGYLLARPASEISVGEVMQFVEGELPQKHDSFYSAWSGVAGQADKMFTNITFADLVRIAKRDNDDIDWMI